MSILVALEALNTSVFITINTAGLSIEVKILKSATATATSSITWLKTSAVRRFSSTDKKCTIRFLFLVFLNPLLIFFNQQSFYVFPVEIIGASGVSRNLKLVKKLSYQSGKLPNKTVANFFDEISSFTSRNCSAREVM